MKYAFTVTASIGYLFSVNSTINACKHFGTDADFYILYHPSITEEVRNSYKDVFPFKVEFIPMADFGNNFFASKYLYAHEIKDKYDSVCVLDGDQFLCSNVNEYFNAAAQGKFVTGTWRSPDSVKKYIPFGKSDSVISFFNCFMSDLSVFFSSKYYPNFAIDWYNQTMQGGGERNHPFVVLNRLICRDIKPDNLIELNCNLWLFDSIYWSERLDRTKSGDYLINSKGEILLGIHNRWWQEGRAKSELINSLKYDNRKATYTGCHNMNLIKDYMEYFNDMTPRTKRDHYLKGTIIV